MMNNTVTDLPYIIAGPMIRRLLPEQMVLWLVTREPLNASLAVHYAEQVISIPCDEITQTVAVGEPKKVSVLTVDDREVIFPERGRL